MLIKLVHVRTVFVVMIFWAALTKYSSAETAERMISACKNIADAKVVGDSEVAFTKNFDTGLCWGAFGSFQKAITYASDTDKERFFGVCAPADSTRTQLIQIFIAYAKRHPEELNKEFFDVALEATIEAFHCRGR